MHESPPSIVRSLLSPALASLALVALAACRTGWSPPAPPADHDARMAWWRDARFGMFLHWGLYAIPAGRWGDGTDHGEWIRTTARIPKDEYAQLQPRWDPTGFDADAWARMAKDAGMKYVVITSKHHDGFCLWDSAVTEWDVANTPDGRDILQELSAACRRHGLKFCTYHSIMDWHHPDYLPRRGWETDRPTDGADFDRFERYLHAQVTEVITRYRPAVMWFDGEWEKTWTHERGVRLFELCRRLAPEMIVNNRVDVHRQGMQGFSANDEAVGDFDTPEQEIPATGLPGVDWESCMTMNRHWGWNAQDTAWKSSADLIRNLVDIASKGGNYLLNVGPRADGTFPPEATERLADIAAWMRVNGAAIHGTTASVFDELPWGRVTVKASDETSKLYLHVFDRPAGTLLNLPGLANEVLGARLLLRPERQLMTMSRRAFGGVQVRLPRELPDGPVTVVELEVAGRPLVLRAPRVAAEADRFVTGLDVTIENRSARGVVRFTLDGSEPTARSRAADGPVRLTATTSLQAALFVDGARASALTQRHFERVDPAPPVKVRPRGDGLEYTRAAVDWQRIPADRSALDGPATPCSGPRLPDGVGERTAVRFAGYLDVPTDELYRFRLTSDDGSHLWIDGRSVVDHDGLHGATAKVGAAALAAGLHRVELVWFNATGDVALDLEWAMPGADFTRVPDAAWKR